MQSLMLHNIVKKFSVNAIFHNQVKFSFCFDNFVQLDDIGVTDFLEYFDFTRDAIYVFSVPNTSLFKNFNSYVFFRQNMLCHLYFSKGTFTEWFTKYIVAKFGTSRMCIGLLFPICLYITTRVFVRWLAAGRCNIDVFVGSSSFSCCCVCITTVDRRRYISPLILSSVNINCNSIHVVVYCWLNTHVAPPSSSLLTTWNYGSLSSTTRSISTWTLASGLKPLSLSLQLFLCCFALEMFVW